MNLQFNAERDKLYVHISGDLDLLVAPSFRAELDKYLDLKQARHLILDFSGVTFIDSSGLGVILGRYKRLTEIGGTLKICNAGAQISKVLELSGLNRIIDIQQKDSFFDRAFEGGK